MRDEDPVLTDRALVVIATIAIPGMIILALAASALLIFG
jgi:hypothetical protein